MFPSFHPAVFFGTLFEFFFGMHFSVFYAKYLYPVIAVYSLVAFLVSFLFIAGTIYTAIKLNQHWRAEKAKQKTGEAVVKKEINGNRKWERLQKHIDSENPNDWRLAILEADIILEELLDKMGYHGETIGDKLKSVEKSDFNTIESAWEAHKIRNTIAHEGSDFLITKREAKRVISLYEGVFKEFRFI